MNYCNEKESIDQNIELLLMTCPGEHTFNPKWGCRIWEMDFERVVSRDEWHKKFTAYVEESISNFESRLKNVSVEINIDDIAFEDHTLKTTSIRKKVEIHVTGLMVSSGETCDFSFNIYLGPLTKE